MRNNNLKIFLLFWILVFFSNSLFSQSGFFEELDLTQAKSEALKQKKKIYIHFTASWCMPCKWMDENTYNKPSIIQEIKENFIPIKINIEENEGKNFKTSFGVTILPTIMLTDHLAKPLAKVETSMSGDQLLEWLKQNPLDAFQEPIPDLIEVKEFYTIQTGVFSEEKNALTHQKDLWDQYRLESEIIPENPKVFRVFSGRFASKNEAAEKILSLKKLGIDGILKPLN